MNKVALLICFTATFLVLISTVSNAQAQQRTIEGQVRSSEGGTLPGVNVRVAGTTRGTATDENGNYSLVVATGDTLIFSYVGFEKREIIVRDQEEINVDLAPAMGSMDELTVVGYGEERRITNTGSVSSIQASQIESVPTPNIQNALAGKLPGYFSQQRSGQPGQDAADFFIRGASSLNSEGNRPLIIVDDVEYSYEQLQQIDVNEIESVSILKDASSTAIYGIKGANGVLVIRTRRGEKGVPDVNARIERGYQFPVDPPNFLNAYQSAQLVNEARLNDGLDPRFTEQDLELFQNGNDPYDHPDINWYDKIFKDYASQTKFNFDISGGSEELQYFISVGALSQTGLVKDFSNSNDQVDNTYFFRRYNFRSNLDYKATETLDLRLDITSRFGNINEPRAQETVSEVFDYTKIRPWSSPFINPNGTYSYATDTEDNLPTINARLASLGYRRDRTTDSNILFQADQDLGNYVEGLLLSTRVAYSSVKENYRSLYRGDNIPAYDYNPDNDSYTLIPGGTYVFNTYGLLGNTDVYNDRLNLQASMQYDNSFGDHAFSGLFLYNQETSNAENNVPANFAGYTLKLGYDYKNKYLFDISAAYNGTDRFSQADRYGFFPAASVGWNVSEEDFFQDAFPFIQLFKLRASYGLVGSDAAPGGRYLYRHRYNQTSNYNFGEAGTDYGSIHEGSLANDNVTWEKVKKFNLGLDMNLLNDNLSVTVDYFFNRRYDQLIFEQGVSDLIGVEVPRANIGITKNRGFDGQISYQNNAGDFLYHTNLVFSYAKNEVIDVDESQPAFPWLSQEGHPIGQPFGYTTVGFYTEDDVATLNDNNPDNDVATPRTEVPIQAGDLKYEDLNDDGVIDENDQSPIGKPNLPTTTLGWSLGANYKGFSVNVLLQGSFDYSFAVRGTGIEPFQSQFQPIHQERWTPENSQNADFPRLSTNPNTVNSPGNYLSDFWLIDAWYVRFKTLDMGYQLPKNWIPLGMDNVRVYVSGYNLFTWTNYDKYQQDPEIASNTQGTSYFNQRVLNLGFDIGF